MKAFALRIPANTLQSRGNDIWMYEFTGLRPATTSAGAADVLLCSRTLCPAAPASWVPGDTMDARAVAAYADGPLAFGTGWVERLKNLR